MTTTESLIAVATGKLLHSFSENCPTAYDPTSRDPDCPACRVIIAAEAQQATHTEALRERLRTEAAMHATRGDEHLSALLDEAALALAQQGTPSDTANFRAFKAINALERIHSIVGGEPHEYRQIAVAALASDERLTGPLQQPMCAGHDLNLHTAAEDRAQQASVPSAEPADDEIAAAVFAVLRSKASDPLWKALTYSSGPYEITSLRQDMLDIARAVLALRGAAPLMANGLTRDETAATASVAELTSSETAGKWEGAEEWMPLAWELCADECGEDACTELVWEGGPVPEPWGDRWLKYEGEAKRLIALVRKHVPAAAPQAATASVAGLAEPTEAQVSMLDPWMRPAAARELLRKVLATGAAQAVAPHPVVPLTWHQIEQFRDEARDQDALPPSHYMAQRVMRHYGIPLATAAADPNGEAP